MRAEPRKRAMPLIPEPFANTISRQSVTLSPFEQPPTARKCCPFRPDLDIPQYLQSLGEVKRAELDQRKKKLVRGASVNTLYSSSEFAWEVCAWNDVFGLILDDVALRMDKRPYQFIETGVEEQSTVKTRVPDATMGLKSYDEDFLTRRYACGRPHCNDDHHSTKQSDARLSEDCLKEMMKNPNCGLLVDGVWGETNLLFPFAVYEAKKRARSVEAAKEQIYHACRMYLSMLDDLSRNPDKVAEYQTEESDRYQVFAFTSCGPQWQVFVAWNFANECMVEVIWEGNVTRANEALELICIVDQIHDYGAKEHRSFVMKHLEAWHDRNKRKPRTPRPSLPKWMSLKRASDMGRSSKAQQTRARNRELRDGSRAQRVEGQPRERGHPLKAAVQSERWAV